jgi:CRP-like cAMP-binding protein
VSGRARAAVAGKTVNELFPGDSFGEIAILHRIGRTATVTAVEPLTTCQLSADAVRAVAVSA